MHRAVGSTQAVELAVVARLADAVGEEVVLDDVSPAESIVDCGSHSIAKSHSTTISKAKRDRERAHSSVRHAVR